MAKLLLPHTYATRRAGLRSFLRLCPSLSTQPIYLRSPALAALACRGPFDWNRHSLPFVVLNGGGDGWFHGALPRVRRAGNYCGGISRGRKEPGASPAAGMVRCLLVHDRSEE